MTQKHPSVQTVSQKLAEFVHQLDIDEIPEPVRNAPGI
jgi:hypothetical protein